MSAFKTILCPIDFSDCSRVALEHAIALARRHSSEVVALHVLLPMWPPLEDFPPYVASKVIEPGARQKVSERLEALVADVVKSIGGEARVRALLVDGFPIDGILAAEKSLSADLLVLGTHGFGFAERLILGSVTERVLRRATKPVLTVPRGACVGAQKAFRTVVCGIDFGEPSLRALDLALGVSSGSGARLVLVHVIESLPDEDPPEYGHFNVPEYRRFLEGDARKRLEALVPESVWKERDTEFVVASGKAYSQILRVAETKDADLIVLGVQGRGSIDLGIFGSTANQLVRHARCPVLTVRKEASSPA